VQNPLLGQREKEAKTMIAVDWSHTKDLTTYDGAKVRVENRASLLKRLQRESALSSCVILEQGCPLSLIYYFTRYGIKVSLIDTYATQKYRLSHNIAKTDENDVRAIYALANNGAGLQPITLDNHQLQLHDLYHQYCRIQKARVAMENMKRGLERHYGIGESTTPVQSNIHFQPMPDFSPYDKTIATLATREKQLRKTIDKLLQPDDTLKAINIRGLGKRIWMGIVVTANPTDFQHLSSYLRYCGLTSDAKKTHSYNRQARMLYRQLAECTLKTKNPEFRPIYDKCKTDIAERHPDYTKMHIHNAALNRTATFLAKRVYQHCHNSPNPLS
jgi:hypothetical protein